MGDNICNSSDVCNFAMTLMWVTLKLSKPPLFSTQELVRFSFEFWNDRLGSHNSQSLILREVPQNQRDVKPERRSSSIRIGWKHGGWHWAASILILWNPAWPPSRRPPARSSGLLTMSIVLLLPTFTASELPVFYQVNKLGGHVIMKGCKLIKITHCLIRLQ